MCGVVKQAAGLEFGTTWCREVICPFCAQGRELVTGTRWPSSPFALALSWGTGTACNKSIIWTIQWKHAYVDLTGIVHRCSSKGQSSLTCTGLVRGRQKTRLSINKQLHGPFVSTHQNHSHLCLTYVCVCLRVFYGIIFCRLKFM